MVNNAWPLTCKASCLKKIELRPLISGFDFALLEVRNLCVASRLQLKPYLARFFWVVVEILTLLIYTENMSITPKLKSPVDQTQELNKRREKRKVIQ
jgi:hypothetical protein